jgi:hypothetical protein
MSETDYKATTEQWKLLQRQGQTLGSAESMALLELRFRVEKLETAQQPRTFTAEEVTPIVAPANRLHSYKIGEAEPIEHWGKDHTLVNPEPVAPTDEDLEDLAEVMNVSGNPVPAMRRALELWGNSQGILDSSPQIEPVAPTDEELWEAYDQMDGVPEDWPWCRVYARAVLARWGQP